MAKRLLTFALIFILVCMTPLAMADSESYKFGFICNGYDNELFANMLETFQILGKHDGIEVFGGEHRADANKLLEEAESMIAAGVDVLMFQYFNHAWAEEVIKSWKTRGVKVISWGDTSKNADVNIRLSDYECGWRIGTMAADWINENLADQDRVEVYIHGHVYEALSLRADGIEAGLRELCPTAVVVERRDILGAEEPNAFENALVTYPDIQVVCSINETSCVSICEWWISELKAKGVDLNRYAGFSVDATNSGLALIAASRYNESIFRGTIDWNIGRLMGTSTVKIWDLVRTLCAGGEAEDMNIEFYEVTAENISDYGY